MWEAEEFLNVLYNSEVLNPVDITIYFMNYYNALIDEKEKEYRITEEEIANAKNWAQKKDLEDDNNYTTTNVKRDEIVKNIESKYGTNWASDLLAKNGSNWDDILENELELQYGEKYDDVIEDIIDDKEHESRLDYDDKDFEDLFDYND